MKCSAEAGPTLVWIVFGFWFLYAVVDTYVLARLFGEYANNATPRMHTMKVSIYQSILSLLMCLVYLIQLPLSISSLKHTGWSRSGIEWSFWAFSQYLACYVVMLQLHASFEKSSFQASQQRINLYKYGIGLDALICSIGGVMYRSTNIPQWYIFIVGGVCIVFGCFAFASLCIEVISRLFKVVSKRLHSKESRMLTLARNQASISITKSITRSLSMRSQSGSPQGSSDTRRTNSMIDQSTILPVAAKLSVIYGAWFFISPIAYSMGLYLLVLGKQPANRCSVLGYLVISFPSVHSCVASFLTFYIAKHEYQLLCAKMDVKCVNLTKKLIQSSSLFHPPESKKEEAEDGDEDEHGDEKDKNELSEKQLTNVSAIGVNSSVETPDIITDDDEDHKALEKRPTITFLTMSSVNRSLEHPDHDDDDDEGEGDVDSEPITARIVRPSI